MRRITCDPAWKSYPIRLTVEGDLSRCCRKTLLLVQSKENGDVKADCSQCAEQHYFTWSQFQSLRVWVSCPECRRAMQPNFVQNLSGSPINYGYECETCSVFIWLADLLPHWQKL